MTDPFRIDGPAVISFSGGRTSAMMLRKIIDAHGGRLPGDVHVAFANTGREMPGTLQFVADCADRWGVEIEWLERDFSSPTKFRHVTHSTASMAGEPFEAAILARRYLPNAITRFCTSELKIVPLAAYVASLGWDSWTNVVGLRADEPRRVARRRASSDTPDNPWSIAMPLADAGVTKDDVTAFWQAQPFDLNIPRGSGNCDLCYLKGWRERARLMQENPELSGWWERMEKERGARFRSREPSYAALSSFARNQLRLPLFTEHTEIPCACTD